MRRRRLVRAPASSANLGPGYDVLAAALQLHLELEVEETGEFAVRSDLDIPHDRSNLVVRAFEHLHPADGFTFTIRSPIPLAGGLGSSAAAIVGSGGAIEAVSDAEILDAYRLVAASEGVFCEPASAAAVAGLLRYGARGARRVVCILTGHGLKDPQAAMEGVGAVMPCEASLEALEEAVLG